MNKDEIIRMAREACDKDKVNAWQNGFFWVITQEELERFATLVASAEREACAKVCEDQADDGTEGEWDGCCLTLAKQIRARGQA